MGSFINEIIGFISKADEIAYYRQAAARERARAAKAGPEDRDGHIENAIDYAEQALDAEREGLDY